jgi:fatty acid desaturase
MKTPKKVGSKPSLTSQKRSLESKVSELEAQIDTMIHDYSKERSSVLVAEIILGVTCLAAGYALGKFL